MRPFHEDWEMRLFYLIHRSQHQKLRKMKKQRNMLQTNEQDKTPETDLNKRAISDLPDQE